MNRGAPAAVVDHVAAIAGEGTLDERCARILAVYRHKWGFVEGGQMDNKIPLEVLREDLFELVAILDELGVTSSLPMRNVRDRLEVLSQAVAA